MLPYQQRVVHERDELAYKLDRLKGFMAGEGFPHIEGEEQALLKKQYEFMLGYFFTLNERIAKFKMTVVSHAD